MAVAFGGAVSLPARAESGPYLRLGVGAEGSVPATFVDQNCKASDPPALFGCGEGRNGEPLRASGAFGTGAVWDGAVGYRFNGWLRGEALLSYRPSLVYSGDANFGTAGSSQPVDADLSSVAGFVVGYADLPRLGRLQPFLGAGIGAARNHIGAVHYSFPSLGDNASTTVVGGTSTNLAWLLTAGVAVPLTRQLSLDVAYRFTDLGAVSTDAGTATIVRPRGTFDLDIAGTHSDLQTHGVLATLRYAFR